MYSYHTKNSRKSTLAFLIFMLTLYGCSLIEPKSDGCSESCYPVILIDTKQDSVEIGSIFRAEVSLSDTTLLFMADFDSEVKRRVHPVFKINGEIVKDHFADSFIVEEVVDSTIYYEEYPNYREISCSIIIPHPRAEEGTIEISKLITYLVKNKKPL